MATIDDPLGLSDSPVRQTVNVAGAELLGLTDSAVALLFVEQTRARVDPLGLTDTGRQVSRAAFGLDALGLTDSVSAQLGIGCTVDDVLGVADTYQPMRVDVADDLADQAGLRDVVAVSTGPDLNFTRPARGALRVVDRSAVRVL